MTVVAQCICHRPAVVRRARAALDVLADADVPRDVREIAGAEAIAAVRKLMMVTIPEALAERDRKTVTDPWGVPGTR